MMITQIKTINDVQIFAKYLVQIEKLSFHPDDDFKDYVDNNKIPLYSEHEAVLRNKLMNECFNICNKNDIEIYELLLHIIQESIYNTKDEQS